MSFEAMCWANKQRPKGGPTSKLVLLILANRADETGVCWPSAERLATDCMVTRQTVMDHVTKLENEGYIVREPRFDADGGRTSNRYRLTMCDVGEGVGNPDRGGVGESGRGGVKDPDRGSKKNRGTPVVQADSESVSEPVNEPSTTRASATVALALLTDRPTGNGIARIKPLPALAEKPTGAAVVQRLATVLDEVTAGARERISAEQRRKLQAGVVFAYWIHKFEHPRALMDDKRERVIVKRLEENGGDVSELLFALDGARNDGWVMGTDARAHHANDGVDFILRDRGSVEKFANTRKKYRDGMPHDLAEKYAAVIAEEMGEPRPSDTPPVAVIEAATGGTDGQQPEGSEHGHRHDGGSGAPSADT